MNVEDEFNMTPDQLREALRFYVGQSFRKKIRSYLLIGDGTHDRRN
jgi:hypothetical protein